MIPLFVEYSFFGQEGILFGSGKPFPIKSSERISFVGGGGKFACGRVQRNSS